MKKILFSFGLIAICFFQVSSQTRVKAMFYNLLNYDLNNSGQSRAPHLKTILDEIQPDLFMVCELKSEAASNYIFSNAIDVSNPDFEKAPWQWGQSPDDGLLQTVYYNSKKLIYESNRVITSNTRDINHYTFKINTENSDTNPIRLEVFVTHLKASRGDTNRQRRFLSIEDFVDALDDIDANSFVLFAGDFNFYTSNEEGYQELIDSGNRIVMIDPIDRPAPNFPNDGKDYFNDDYDSQYFWNNSSFADIHTQSTRTSNSGLIETSGSGGGLDDRFDFIMMSENFNSSSDLYYVNGSYKSVGNNGNCYNSFISSSGCSGSYSQTLRNSLIEVSDHLPVVMEIETPQNTLSTKTYSTFNFSNKNHTRDFLEIQSNIPLKQICIYNQLGQLVRVKNIGEETKISLDVQNLSKGIYYITNSNQSAPLKFIKL